MKTKNIKVKRLAKAGCGECNSGTVIPVFPTFTTGLNTATAVKNGGINAIAFLKCSDPLADETDVAEWNAAITAGDLLVRHDCFFRASMEAEETSEDFGACLVPVVTNRRMTISFEDPADNSTYDVHAFYRYLQANPGNFLVAYFLCDGRVYGFQKALSIIVRESHGQTKNERSQWTGEIVIDTLIQPAPIAPAVGATISLSALTL